MGSAGVKRRLYFRAFQKSSRDQRRSPSARAGCAAMLRKARAMHLIPLRRSRVILALRSAAKTCGALPW